MNLFVTQILFVKVIMALFYESNHHCIVYYQSPRSSGFAICWALNWGFVIPFDVLSAFILHPYCSQRYYFFFHKSFQRLLYQQI